MLFFLRRYKVEFETAVVTEKRFLKALLLRVNTDLNNYLIGYIIPPYLQCLQAKSKMFFLYCVIEIVVSK